MLLKYDTEMLLVLVPQVVLGVQSKSYKPLKEAPKKSSCSEAGSSDKFQGLFPVSGPH